MPLRGWRVLLVCWMGIIYLLSSSLMVDATAFDATELIFGSINYVARKIAHVAEYAILAYLWFRSIWTRRERFAASVSWSVGLSVLYSITDEVHQMTVPARSAAWTDVLIDAAGATALAAVLIGAERGGTGAWRERLLGPLGGAPLERSE